MPKFVRFQSSYAEPYPLQIVGESFHKNNIEDVSNYTGEDEGVNADDYIARLILEDESIHDRGNAVRVEIAGKPVGHLSKPDARKYRQKLIKMGIQDVVGECYASIKGGFIKRDGSQADFGVRLDLDLETLKIVELKPIKSAGTITTTTTQPAEKTQAVNAKPVPPKRKLSFFGFLFLFLLIIGIIGTIVDQISLVLENAGYRATRTPAPTATLNFLEELHLTSTALYNPDVTPTP